MKKKVFFLTLLIVTIQCFSQTYSIVGMYRSFTNGKELQIILFSDSTYNFCTYWGKYHGLWEIYENEEDSSFDKINFYDDAFTTTKAYYSSHISLSNTIVNQIDSLNESPKKFFVTMFDLSGKSVPYYNVCFCDSTNEIIDCRYNPDKKDNKSFIPFNAKTVWMIGDLRNLSSYFKCNYSTSEGNIAFIIGPSVGRFYINKERDIIRYCPCYCEDHKMNCSVTFNKYSN